MAKMSWPLKKNGTSSSPLNRFGFHSSPRKLVPPSDTDCVKSPPKRKTSQYGLRSDWKKNLKRGGKSTGIASSDELCQSAPTCANSASSTTTISCSVEISSAKAGYLCLKPSLSDDIDNIEDLEMALQFCGMNPTSRSLNKYWTSPTITFSDFEEILATENATTNDGLALALARLDPSGSGLIPKRILRKVLVNRGERLPLDLVDKYVENSEFCDSKDGNFNYIKFLNESIKTSNKLLLHIKEVAAESERNLTIDSKTYKVPRKTSSPQMRQHSTITSNATPIQWMSSKCSKGAFYFEGESLISHQYNVEIHVRQKVEISIESLDDSVDCQLFIFKVNDVVANRNSDSRYLLIERTPMSMPYPISNGMSGCKRVMAWTGQLDPASYLLVPSTTGCRLRRRKSQPVSDVQLVDVAVTPNGKKTVSLSTTFREVLVNIFDQVDLDRSGGLSRREFNLFNWRTSGEEVQDEEWKVVQENFKLVNGELPLEGFMQLHQMEAEDNGGDSAELWVTLNSMGYNYNLLQDEAAVFQVAVKGEDVKSTPNFYVSGLRSGGPILDKATIKCVMDGSGRPQSINGISDILLYREDLPDHSSVVIQNKSASTVTLNMDFGKSKNVLINHPHMSFSTTLSARSTLIVAHLIRDDPNRQHSVSEDITLV